MQRSNYSIDFPYRNHVYPRNMFRVKLLCQIIDFSNNFELLHFQFDRWLYKTVSGIIQTGILKSDSSRRNVVPCIINLKLKFLYKYVFTAILMTIFFLSHSRRYKSFCAKD